MAKAKMTAKKTTGRSTKSARGGTSTRGGTSRRGVGRGEGLEVGNARRDAGAATGPLPRATAKRPARKTPLQLPGEKAVTRTSASVPVEPRRRPPGDNEPMPGAAIDRRRQIVGTDDKGRRGGR
jgi:hypothetical protein